MSGAWGELVAVAGECSWSPQASSSTNKSDEFPPSLHNISAAAAAALARHQCTNMRRMLLVLVLAVAVARVSSECLTLESQEPCQLPFVFRNRTHLGCTVTGDPLNR